MLNKVLVTVCIAAFFVVIALNVIPFFWSPSPATYIRQDNVNDMAVVYKGLPYTLNFDQQKRVIEILNRAIPVGEIEVGQVPVDFDQIVIYPFDEREIVITPIAWVDNNLLFDAPAWSQSHLMEVSRDELHKILSKSYDTLPYARRPIRPQPAAH